MVSFVRIYADASGESQTSISRSSKPLEDFQGGDVCGVVA
jgi:hypothetical protein